MSPDTREFDIVLFGATGAAGTARLDTSPQRQDPTCASRSPVGR